MGMQLLTVNSTDNIRKLIVQTQLFLNDLSFVDSRNSIKNCIHSFFLKFYTQVYACVFYFILRTEQGTHLITKQKQFY